jgi:hypothetical protein
MAQLAGMLGVIATSATTSVFLCDAFRLARTCIWATPATAGVPVTVSLKYVDDPASSITAGAPRTLSDSSVSFDRPAYACLEPPKDNTSMWSQWEDSSLNSNVLSITAPVGSIVDFHFNCFIDDVGTTSAGPTLAAATAGVLYHKSFTAGAATFTAVLPQNTI